MSDQQSSLSPAEREALKRDFFCAPGGARF